MSQLTWGGHSGDDEAIGMPESSVFYVQNGELMLQARGKLYPAQGGTESGHTVSYFNVSEHIRGLIAAALANGQSPED